LGMAVILMRAFILWACNPIAAQSPEIDVCIAAPAP
jgi:hypothetical protein